MNRQLFFFKEMENLAEEVIDEMMTHDAIGFNGLRCFIADPKWSVCDPEAPYSKAISPQLLEYIFKNKLQRMFEGVINAILNKDFAHPYYIHFGCGTKGWHVWKSH